MNRSWNFHPVAQGEVAAVKEKMPGNEAANQAGAIQNAVKGNSPARMPMIAA